MTQLPLSLSPEQLKQIEHYASIFMSVSDIAILLELDAMVLKGELKNRQSDFYRAYAKGKLESKAKIMSQEMQLAQVGSPLALENTRLNLLAMDDDDDL